MEDLIQVTGRDGRELDLMPEDGLFFEGYRLGYGFTAEEGEPTFVIVELGESGWRVVVDAGCEEDERGYTRPNEVFLLNAGGLVGDKIVNRVSLHARTSVR